MKTLGSKSLLLNFSVAILPNHFWTKNAWEKFGRTHPFFRGRILECHKYTTS